MTESQQQMVSAAREQATDILSHKLNKNLRYHNLEHTQGVVMACDEMANYYQLQPDDRAALLIAAWFHDTGFSSGDSHGHEAVSVSLATSFLQEQNAGPAFIQKVTGCIEATRMPQNPNNLIEQIICDADLSHIGTDEFNVKNEQLRQELIDFAKEDVSKKKWRKMNIAFLESHTYFTDFGRRKLQPIKEQHLGELKSEAKEDAKDKEGKEGKEGKKAKEGKEGKEGKKNKTDDGVIRSVLGNDTVPLDPEAKKKKDKENQTERGISTVFRIMANNHSSLSQMADSKANIMISVNSIILSILISMLIRHLDENPFLVYPTITLVLVCVGATIFAILATRPNITEGTFTKEDIQNKKTNLLFFGNFHNMTLPDYDWAMKEMLNDKNYLYGSMVKDIYFLGVVLAKKYRYLRISYNIFMYGLIVSMLMYGVMTAYESFFVSHTVVETGTPLSPP
ncbi:MAG TPA: Pycsar system effector family protein [Chitinophagaceae bacterium]|nr:Pycsar system effector family protein [Chitinophagaceae bacterium]